MTQTLTQPRRKINWDVGIKIWTWATWRKRSRFVFKCLMTTSPLPVPGPGGSCWMPRVGRGRYCCDRQSPPPIHRPGECRSPRHRTHISHTTGCRPRPPLPIARDSIGRNNLNNQITLPPPPPHWDRRAIEPNHIKFMSSSADAPLWTPL